MDLLLRFTQKFHDYKKDKFILGVSGGMDSMALAQFFCHWRKHFGVQFAVAYVHHGPSQNKVIQDYRLKAWQFVRDFCTQRDILFFSNFKGDEKVFFDTFQEELSSENDFREYRQDYFAQLQNHWAYDWLVLAHHQQDLLETRLIRLIRGVGPEGLESMQEIGDGLMRPLLGFSNEELKRYLKSLEQSWVEDPSNNETAYLRNWLRKVWLPQLEEKREGALKSLSRSLDLILGQNKNNSELFSCLQEGGIVLSEFLLLSKDEKSQVLATYMKDHKFNNYGQSHIKELLKRLDSEKKSLKFQLLGRTWSVDAGRLKVL